MPFISKDEAMAYAAKHDLDISGLTWPQVQKVISEHKKKIEKETKPASKVFVDPTRFNTVHSSDPVQINKQAKVKQKQIEPSLDQFKGKTILISPEIRPQKNQRFKYEEVIGDELEVEEANYNGMTLEARNTNEAHGTYVVKGKTGRKVTALSTIPKENAGITFRPDIDMFPVVTFEGKSGYLLTHSRLPNVKATLKESGYWEDYRERFSEAPNVWYAAGKQLVCDISMVHHVMNEIERRERNKRDGR